MGKHIKFILAVLIFYAILNLHSVPLQDYRPLIPRIHTVVDSYDDSFSGTNSSTTSSYNYSSEVSPLIDSIMVQTEEHSQGEVTYSSHIYTYTHSQVVLYPYTWTEYFEYYIMLIPHPITTSLLLTIQTV